MSMWSTAGGDYGMTSDGGRSGGRARLGWPWDSTAPHADGDMGEAGAWTGRTGWPPTSNTSWNRSPSYDRAPVPRALAARPRWTLLN